MKSGRSAPPASSTGTPERQPNWRAERGAFPTAAPAPALPDITVRTSLPPASTAQPEVAAPSPALSGVAASVGDILRESEIARAKVFYRVMAVISTVVLAALPILPGPTWLRIQTAVACFAATCICLVMTWRTRDGGAATRSAEPGAASDGADLSSGRYTENVAAATAVSLSALAILIIYYLGLFSASATILAVGIYFFGSSESRRVARLGFATTAALYFLLTLGIAVDLVPDLGVFSSASLARPSRFYRVFMEQIVFGMVFYLARSVRRANQATLERAREKDLELRQREAQLLEAKGELDRALRQGEGRLTGQAIEHFQIGDLLGRGGMGEVYAALDNKTRGQVAIKFLHPAMLDDPSNVERFLREAQATAAVPSEHVARVLEVGTTQRGVPFIAMELLEGHDLAFYLRRAPQLPLHQVVEMVEHVARALAAVRDAGIVHRDLKPGNIFLTDTLPRTWKVLDFGLSKLHGAASLTKDQAVGTPSYMSPEQVRGKEVDHLADLYALTAIAYRAITGRPPFVGDEVAKVLMDVISRMPEPPGEFARVPMDVELVLALGLAKRRGERLARVEDLALAFRAAMDGSLDDATRARGWAVLKQSPWGERIRR